MMFNRRRFFQAVSVTAFIGLAGCTGSQGGDDPEETAVNYIETLYQGEPEPINEFIHPDAPLSEFSEAEANDYNDFIIEELNSEIISEEDETAEVEIEITISGPAGTYSNSGIIGLRTDDGEWKIWNAP